MNSKEKYEQEVQRAISLKEWRRVVNLSEEFELDVALEGGVPAYGVHLLAYYLVKDENNARFLWKRIPANVKASNVELVALWKIGQALWRKNFQEIYTALGAFTWTEPHKTLVNCFAEQFRQDIFQLLSRAYTAISTTDASVYLGLPPAEVIKETTQRGWTLDTANNLLLPKQGGGAKDRSTGLVHLQQLTEYFAYLEN